MGLRARGRHYTQRWSSITELGLSTAPPEGGSENLCHFHNVLSCSEITQRHPAWEGNIIPPPPCCHKHQGAAQQSQTASPAACMQENETQTQLGGLPLGHSAWVALSLGLQSQRLSCRAALNTHSKKINHLSWFPRASSFSTRTQGGFNSFQKSINSESAELTQLLQRGTLSLFRTTKAAPQTSFCPQLCPFQEAPADS